MKNTTWIALVLVLTAAIAVAEGIPEEAKKHMARGTIALDMAKDEAGYSKAIVEFEAAATAAPNWPDPHFNLGTLYPKIGEYERAIKCFKRYLELSPKAEDAETVKTEIYKLEYRVEDTNKVAALYGFWYSVTNKNMEIRLTLSGNGKQSNMILYCPTDYTISIPDIEIANGAFDTREGTFTNRLAGRCTFNFVSMTGTIDKPWEISFKLGVLYGGDCGSPGTQIQWDNHYWKGNFAGFDMELAPSFWGGYEHTNAICGIWSGSLAEKVGLKVGDRIISINEKKYKPISNLELTKWLNSDMKDPNITITVERKGEEYPLIIKIKRPW